ncbi:thioesterase family protein [Micromonospora sp. WMMD1082]|uniref:acyl-CoA thioesterase n=1 Tax=Micromonospora sp. WMMD1082 TaxID=3016104 RepID=UPI002417E38D|nr:thioesterase family protein [Micromonospora sp. WMMD1082]MDG4795637.1 hotdog domain-containing protein [Micromonospora sp. WMMD1082]
MTFTFDSDVFFDEFDPNGHLHNARFPIHVERAQSALFEQLGFTADRPAERAADLCYVVRELHLEFLAPVTVPGTMTVALTGTRLGTTSAAYAFRCGTDPVYAHGHRVIVKVDPDTRRPAPWSDRFRSAFLGTPR